jgi:dihydropyrimidinase
MSGTDLLVSGGSVLREGSFARENILCRGGRIAAIGRGLKAPSGVPVLDASGLLVLPGVIDAHVHYRLKLGPSTWNDDTFDTGSAAALTGGVTTVIDYTGQGRGVPLRKGLDDRLAEAQGRMHCDYAFHCVVPSWSALKDPAGQVARLVKEGAPTFKFFSAYAARGLMTGAEELYQALEVSRETGSLVCLHAENGPVIDFLSARPPKAPGACALALTRPPATEWAAAASAAAWAEHTGGELYLVHVSHPLTAAIAAGAVKRGARVYVETCPQYLALDESLLRRRDGHLYSCCPPLRDKASAAGLWRAASGGSVNVVATDSCAFTRARKDAWRGDLSRLPMGLPGTATLLPLVYTLGVKKGKISLARMAELLCSGPARLMGLYPRKGVIRKGSDADFALLDPRAAGPVDWRDLGHASDYSPYQGMKLYGFPRHTVLRGKVVMSGGKLLSPSRPGGVYLKRKRL